jgi:hypothetical protein
MKPARRRGFLQDSYFVHMFLDYVRRLNEWYFSIFNGKERICHYECMWEDEIVIADDDLNMKIFLKLLKMKVL